MNYKYYFAVHYMLIDSLMYEAFLLGHVTQDEIDEEIARVGAICKVISNNKK